MSGLNHLYSEIRGYVHYAMSHHDEPDALHRALGAIEKITRQGTDFINYLDILDTQDVPVLEPYSLCDLIDESLRERHTTMPERDITVVRKFAAAPWIMADTGLLKRAFNALFQISTQFILSASKETLVVSIDQDEETAFMNFLFTGEGFSESEISRSAIAEACAKSMIERDKEIARIGLHGARKIIEMHDGHLSLTDGDGESKGIFIALPREKNVPVSGEDSAALPGNEIKMNQNLSVLIADDDLSIRELLKTILVSMGISHCDMAANGEEASERAISGNYDLIFMDVSMPVLSGIDAFKRIKAIKPSVKVIFITGLYQEDEIVEKLYEENAYGYIRKPFNIAEIKKIIAGVAQG